MSDLLRNKTILVTGASGIGKSIAKESAKHGATVLTHYHNNEIEAKQSLDEVKRYSKGNIFSANLSKYNEVKKTI